MNQNIVTETSKNLRVLARVSMQGKWKTAVIATAIYMIALSMPAMILDVMFGGVEGVSPLSGLYTFVVAGPFTLGYAIFCLNMFRNKETEIAQVFYGFEKFVKTLGLYFVMMIFIFLWSLLLVVPGIIAAYRYSQCFLIMADHPEYTIMQCLAESKRIMVGNKFKYFCLELSFLGWAILVSIPVGVIGVLFAFGGLMMANIGVLIGSIGFFWLTPYMSVAGVAFYELAMGNLRPGVIEVDPISVNVHEERTAELEKPLENSEEKSTVSLKK